MNRLQKCLFLCEPENWLGDIRTNGKAMLDATEKVDLIGLPSLGQNLLAFMALFGRENAIGFWYSVSLLRHCNAFLRKIEAQPAADIDRGP